MTEYALKIESKMAESMDALVTTWEGKCSTTNLDTLFRTFNRVDDEDYDRLDRIGYKLPSLSVGDLITVDGVTSRVDSLGFTKVSDPNP